MTLRSLRQQPLVCLLVMIFCFQGCLSSASTNRFPQFSQSQRAQSVKEEQPTGIFILRSTATDYDGDEITYSLEGDVNGYFQIDPKKGDLKTAKVIDRESLNNSLISFKIVASESDNPAQKSFQTVDIIITDINDNAPVFTKENINKVVNITENNPGSTFVTHIKASDKDESASDLFYRISAGNEDKYFKIDLYNGKITTTKALDYEKKKAFKLTVVAMDGRPKDKNAHTVSTFVYINVKDEDDNGPIFDANYTASIVEGVYKGTILTKVHAEDQDKGINSPISYYIEKASNRDGLFSINKDGYIFVNGEIDREKNPIFNLEVRAKEDKDGLAFQSHPPAKATVIITVTDVNDNPPKFTHEFVGSMVEHARVGTKVLTVTASDADEGENAKFTLSLKGGDSQYFSVDPNGDIRVQADLDREKDNVYTFNVEAIQDGFSTNAETKVTVIVQDKNDHKPIFKRTNYIARISENLPLNTTVLTVEATDRDANENSRIVYSILSHQDGACFKIHPTKGTIVLNCRVDRELKERYDFLVMASDQARFESRQSNQVQVSVYIEDLNDNSPKFNPTEYYKSINYDEALGSTIVTVKATDKDTPTSNFGKVWYRIISGNEQDKFAIKKETGALLVGSGLGDLYGIKIELEIEAYDSEGVFPYRKSARNAVVTIQIEKGLNSVVIEMNVKTTIVIANKNHVVRQLEEILGDRVKTDRVDAGPGKTTRFVFHCYQEDSYSVVSWEDILEKLSRYQGVLMSDFMKNWNVTSWTKDGGLPKNPPKGSQLETAEDEPEKNGTWTPIIYAVLGFSALIVIFGIIGILYLIRSRRRFIDGGASQTSSRVPITARGRSRSYWNDPGFESVSQINTESYVHSSGFLANSVGKYELDPSNMYASEGMYNDDPFSVIIERPPSCNSNSSHASSGFAASSVMTVYRAPNMVQNGTTPNGDSQPLLNNPYKPTTRPIGVSPRDRRLSIVKEDNNSKPLLDRPKSRNHRPPSYEYDFDTKLPDDYS